MVGHDIVRLSYQGIAEGLKTPVRPFFFLFFSVIVLSLVERMDVTADKSLFTINVVFCFTTASRLKLEVSAENQNSLVKSGKAVVDGKKIVLEGATGGLLFGSSFQQQVCPASC